eukprot:TRINITY_DN0_c0_g1_i2.p1 TRINITY_DN0_c0_g1~~TRINITY_DN0_c0_g1_i2.p1  ORF type:complete len:402 (+),score=149.33 TRINITY_DN0_c0_g1_i2:69-1274(+)
MRKEILSFILLICLTFTNARTFRARQAAGLPWDPPVSNIGQAVAVNGAAYDYSVTLTISKTVSGVTIQFAIPAASIATETPGWSVTFDGTTATATLKQMVIGGMTTKATFLVTAPAGFKFPELITTTAVYEGQPETQEFRFQPSAPLPTAAPAEPENFISTAGHSYSTDGSGTYQFTYTFQAFRALNNLAVSFSFPNTEVVKVASATNGATATSQNGIVTVTYANPIVAETTITTTVSVSIVKGAFNTPTKFDFTTTTAQGPQTQTLTFKTKPSNKPEVPITEQKPLGFTHISHGIKAGRGYLEIAYHLDITTGSNLDSWFAELTFPMTINKAEGGAKTTATLSAGNAVKLEWNTPVTFDTKLSAVAYLKVASYASLQLPQSIDFYYTVAGTQYHSKVKFD